MTFTYSQNLEFLIDKTYSLYLCGIFSPPVLTRLYKLCFIHIKKENSKEWCKVCIKIFCWKLYYQTQRQQFVNDLFSVFLFAVCKVLDKITKSVCMRIFMYQSSIVLLVLVLYKWSKIYQASSFFLVVFVKTFFRKKFIHRAQFLL